MQLTRLHGYISSTYITNLPLSRIFASCGSAQAGPPGSRTKEPKDKRLLSLHWAIQPRHLRPNTKRTGSQNHIRSDANNRFWKLSTRASMNTSHPTLQMKYEYRHNLERHPDTPIPKNQLNTPKNTKDGLGSACNFGLNTHAHTNTNEPLISSTRASSAKQRPHNTTTRRPGTRSELMTPIVAQHFVLQKNSMSMKQIHSS